MSFPSSLNQHIKNASITLNPLLCNGIAYEHLKLGEAYIDQVMRSFEATAPPGLVYVGCRRCTPQEELDQLTKVSSRRTYDVAKHQIYLMRYDFTYEGYPITRYIFLPTASRGGFIYLKGSRYGITPILADRVVSIDVDFVFVRLLMAKLTIRRESKTYIANDEIEEISVAWSRIHNTGPKDAKPSVRKPKHTLVHYLFCKYGFEETFRRFGKENEYTPGPVPIVGDDTDITEENYPPSKWVICRSRQKAPPSMGRQHYEPCFLRLAIKKTEYTTTVKNLVAGFFYVVDLFPRRMQPKWVTDTNQWRVLLGNLIWPESMNYGRLLLDTNEHLNSLDGYLDALNKHKLTLIDLPSDDVYQLFGHIINRINDWLLGPKDRVNTMWNKELQVLYYVFMQITESICNLGFKLQSAQSKNHDRKPGMPPKSLDRKKITAHMNTFLKKWAIFGMTFGHGEVSSQNSPSDNLALKTTCQLVPQSKSTAKAGRGNHNNTKDPSLLLHASIAEVGGYANLPKSEPTGRRRINPTLTVSPLGLVIRAKHYRALLDGVQETISRKTEYLRRTLDDEGNELDPTALTIEADILEARKEAERDAREFESSYAVSDDDDDNDRDVLSDSSSDYDD